MSHTYRAVQWNPFKRRYDLVVSGAIGGYVASFVGLGAALYPEATLETLTLRALGTAALLSLHLVLAIGPLARLDRRWLPVLYNRRHLGVATCLVALAHGLLALGQFHALGDVSPLESLLTAESRWDSFAHFPFQPLGALALLVLVLMAATSHDFWLANLTAPVWKALHMLVYPAYGLVVMHVALGAVQADVHPALPALLAAGAVTLLALHVAAARREACTDLAPRAPQRVPRAGDGDGDGTWLDVGATSDLREGRAKVVFAGGERVALFLHEGRVSALSSVCQHQNGPLGEGRIVDGLAVCPWHGFQYQLRCGRSPAPFHEVVPTFRVRIEAGRVLLSPRPLPLGTSSEPVAIGGEVTQP